jgi:hypothetical protein
MSTPGNDSSDASSSGRSDAHSDAAPSVVRRGVASKDSGGGREQVAIEHVIGALSERYAEEVPPEQVEAAVRESQETYADAPIRDFVPILVERDVRETLDDEVPAAEPGAAEPGATEIPPTRAAADGISAD